MLNIKIIPVTPFRQNCTLLWDDTSAEAVLLDVGGDVAHVLNAIKEMGLNLKEIWLTHGHLDHVAGVPELLEQCPVNVLGPHADDEFLLRALPQITAQFGFLPCPAFLPNRYLQEGDTVRVGAYEFQVLHVFGHTPGHVVFYCASEKVLLAGDTLFFETIGRTDFEHSNTDDLLRNIRQKLFTLPDDVRVLPGHGWTTNIGHERTHNPFFQ